MAQTLERTRTASPGSGGGWLRNIVIVVVLVAVAGIAGYALKDKIPGLQPQPTSALPATAFTEYEKFWNEHPEGVPPELSVGVVTRMADGCAGGSMLANVPDYLAADQFGRARAGWVCLRGRPAGAPNSTCRAPGTNDWRSAHGLGPIASLQNGHLIGKSLNGDGAATRNGQCVNITPQSIQPNNLMRSRAEIPTADLAGTSPVPVFYVSVAVYTGRNYVPDGIWVFVISSGKTMAPGPFMNDAHHIAWPGGMAP